MMAQKFKKMKKTILLVSLLFVSNKKRDNDTVYASDSRIIYKVCPQASPKF